MPKLRPFLSALAALPAPVPDTLPAAAADGCQVTLRALERPGTASLTERLLAGLSPDERAAASAIPHPGRRAEFAAGHWMRARALDKDGAAHTSLSHSAGQVVLASCARGPLGVDIEAVRPRAGLERLAARFFSPAEHAALVTCGDSALPLLFYALWTAKEARIKALPRRPDTPAPGLSLLSAMEMDLSASPETTAFRTVALPVAGGAVHWFWWPGAVPGTPRLMGACLCPNGTGCIRFIREMP